MFSALQGLKERASAMSARVLSLPRPQERVQGRVQGRGCCLLPVARRAAALLPVPPAGPASVQPVPGLPNGQVGASVPFHRVMFCRIQEELAEKFVIGQHHFRAWGRG